MKLRIKGNSIRFRLTKPEVEKLSEEEFIEEKTVIGKNTFTYGLHKSKSHDQLSAEYNDNKLNVFIPSDFADVWAENNIVGIDNGNISENSETLHLLVEKDFKCLDETSEDQSDNFENPNTICN